MDYYGFEPGSSFAATEVRIRQGPLSVRFLPASDSAGNTFFSAPKRQLWVSEIEAFGVASN